MSGQYCVNTKSFVQTFGGVRFLPGIHYKRQPDIELAKQDPLGRGKMVGEEIQLHENLDGVAAEFSSDALIDLINLSIEGLRMNNTGSTAMQEKKLREMISLPDKTASKYAADQLKMILTGERSSKFGPYQR